MAKNSITDYSKTASLNTDIQSVDIDEGCLPSGINNAIRELMADLAAVNDGTVALTSPAFTSVDINSGTIDGTIIGNTTPAAGNFTSGSFTGNLSFGDNAKAIFGAGNDLEIFHNGSNSVIKDAGVGNLYLQGTNLFLTDSAGYNFVGMVDNGTGGTVTLYHNSSAKLTTTATGIDVTGTVTADGLTVNSGATDEVARFEGTGSPYISWYDTGVRQAYIGSFGNSFEIVGDTPDTTVKISTGGATRVTVNSTGINVTGTVTADGLTVDGDAVINLASTTGATLGQKGGLELFANSGTIGNGGELTWQSGSGSTETWAAISGYILENNASGSRGHMLFGTKNASTDTVLSERMRIASNGDISFYEDTGTTPKFFWDASAESLGLSKEISFTNTANTSGFDIGLVGGDADATAFIYQRANDSIRFGSNNILRAEIAASGDISFYEDTGTTVKLKWDASAERLGLGTSSPLNKLDLAEAGDTQLRITSTDGNNVRLGLNSSGTVYNWIEANGTNLLFAVGNAERLRIDSSGRVGIGTSSPDKALTISASDSQVRLYDADGTNQFASFQSDNGTTKITSRNNTSHGTIAFQRYNGTTVAESMRIDSSGNVLVGKTSTSSATTTVGFHVQPSGVAVLTRDGGAPLRVSRKTSDGEVISIHKDGTTVGSIGVNNANNTFIGSAATDHTGFEFGNDVLPRKSNSTADNQTNLGSSSIRFANLFLGGGVYLGGTGDANKLEDYEEGTWTPSYTTGSGSFSSITYSEQNGTYVKIGRLVVVSFDLRTDSVSLGTASGVLYVTGLPFNINGSQGTGQCGAQNGWVTNSPEYLNIADGSNYGFLRRTNGAGYSDITVSNLTTGSSAGANRILGCSIAYYTNS